MSKEHKNGCPMIVSGWAASMPRYCNCESSQYGRGAGAVTPQEKREWEEEFEAKFGGITAHDAGQNWLPMYEQILAFIRSLITAAEERVDIKKGAQHRLAYQKWYYEGYQRGLVEMKERVIKAPENRAEVVGNSAKTADQAIHTVRSLDVPKKED